MAKDSSARKITRSGNFGDGFLSRVDQIGVFFAFEGIRSDAEHAIFGLQDHFDAGRQIIGDQRGQADAQVDVVAVAQFARDAAGNAFALVDFGRHSKSPPVAGARDHGRLRTVRRSIRLRWSLPSKMAST
jgi:hypothetical protein